MSRKRSRQHAENDNNIDGSSDSTKVDLVAHGNASPNGNMDIQGSGSKPSNDDNWQEVPSQGKKKRRINPAKGTTNYPSIYHSPNARLQTNVKISDLQHLILYILSDGPAPQWVAIRHRDAIKKVVAITIPGFDPDLFTGRTPLLRVSEQPANIEAVSTNSAYFKDSNTASPADVDTTDANQERKDGSESTPKRVHLSPDDYYPKKLDVAILPATLRPFADMFTHIWPVKAPGDDKYAKIHSPLQSMLLTPLPKSKDEKKKKGPSLAKSNDFVEKLTPITEFIASAQELESSDYVLHPALCETEAAKASLVELRRSTMQSTEHGWIDTATGARDAPEQQASADDVTGGRHVIAIDCEMCKTGDEQLELTRISVLDWDGNIVLDELVKPEAPITDYLTQYSGITEEMLAPVTTRLTDIQKRLQEVIKPSTIIIGHSLDGDFKALRMTHPHIVDTAIIYPHPRGPPLKSSLKWLAQKYLGREIQKSHGTTGHDSVEDAKAVLDLVKQKCQKGHSWGTNEASSESIFNRIKRSPVPKIFRKNPGEEEFRSSAVVDWGNPTRGLGANADVIRGCENDSEVAEQVKRLLVSDDNEAATKGVDFIWARFREVEAVRGWWEKSKTSDNNEMRQQALARYSLTEEEVRAAQPNLQALSQAVANTVKHLSAIYEALPPCTAFIVYSGHGDPREVFRMQALHQQFRDEYRTKKWDQLSVKWTDVEEQQMRRACKKAREGLGFITVK
ncbi:uncharacterized protein PV09_01845 [Verruconis gallopava]|uniref:Exonuclease domain-containing protein n=1 Tax=Verruconis gallopava TaxID=253628 RepID=A0A0D1XYT6_9PEZI|nr:uncharacterized protein PV09_01845 [Verruconis gallopava]KIW07941.1 hypothetical protein PV09_01845 [Verruconis gallopava]